ncbi:efflux RND transporter periplasmic adaptor subunit [Craterilacuibacter sp.]|uniref:efflux RND transporter periplasmic adaptor subunit n=1 Tax=Craterilacuibacter sp. TaxID=2870909 RepID=UPI003F3E0E7D
MNKGWQQWLLAGALIGIVSACGKKAEPTPDIRPVRTLLAGGSSAQQGGSYAGEVRARHESRLAFRVPGKVVERYVSAGEQVKKGQPLARLDASDYTLDLAAKQAALSAARAELIQQEADLARSRELLKQSFISQAQFDRQQSALEAARARMKQAGAQAGVSGNQAGYAVLNADADGVISEISAEPGLVVTAGQPVAKLAADGEREVAIQVPENALDKMRSSKALTITLWHNQQQYPGELRELAGDADPATRTYAARVRVLAADAKLQLGQTARVALPASASQGLRLPLSAILDTGGKHYVWVVNGKTLSVKQRAVTIAKLDGEGATLSGGLQPGERVVTAGVHLLRDGQSIKLLQP